MNHNTVGEYDSSNSYNILVYEEGDELDLDNLTTEKLMVSRTFELSFESWYAIARYLTIRVINDTLSSVKQHINVAIQLDSASAINAAVADLNVPDSISKVDVQLLHFVLSDSRKIEAESSSSGEQSSSSEDPISSSSSETTSSSSEVSSSSSKIVSSSSAKESAAIGWLGGTPRTLNSAREVRRLNGSVVKAGETLQPGVYYVKGVDGRWRKQIELPR